MEPAARCKPKVTRLSASKRTPNRRSQFDRLRAGSLTSILLADTAGRSLDRPRQDVVTCRRDTRSLHVSRVRPLGHGGADEPGLRLTARGDDRRICPSGPHGRLARDGFGVLAATIGFGDCRMTWRRAGADAFSM